MLDCCMVVSLCRVPSFCMHVAVPRRQPPKFPNVYPLHSPEVAAIESAWHVERNNPWRWPKTAHGVLANYMAPFLRAATDLSEAGLELVVGQWSLIPWFAKEVKQKYATVAIPCSYPCQPSLRLPESS